MAFGITALILMASGAISSAAMFGGYEYFRGKGYGPWASGGLIGAVSSLIGIGFMYMQQTMAGELPAANAEMAGCLSGGCAGLAGVTLTQIPGSIGAITAQQLSGITVQELNGITVQPLGAMPRQRMTPGRSPKRRYPYRVVA